MAIDFREQLDVFTHGATESEVWLNVGFSQRGIRAFQGELRGPRCSKAKTLQASFAIDRCERRPTESEETSILVTEPCYWTPELPMLYDLTLEVELADGTKTTWRQAIGLRRWEIHGRDFFRNGKRVVLRGAAVKSPTAAQIQQAVDAELALVVREPSTEFLQQSSDLGVSLVIDLRSFGGELGPTMRQLSWHPAVELVLLGDAPATGSYYPWARKVGVFTASTNPQANNVALIELGPGKRPPDWAARLEIPVIAIRTGGTYPEFSEARRACDRLQAELAPEFDLAGYFV